MNQSKTNNYDDVAIARAKNFARDQNLHHAYIEKPAMLSLLPDLRGKRVLCLGCGTGEEVRELLGRGASVYGVDVSKVSIEYARKHIPEAQFEVLDMDTELQRLADKAPFDFIYSSLVLHYSNDIGRLIRSLHRLLKPKGQFLFSTTHPLKWAAKAYRDPADDTRKSFLMGYEREGQAFTVYGDYLSEQRLLQHYPDGLTTEYWSRTPSAYFKLLTSAGFEIREFLEPGVSDEVSETDLVFWEIHRRLPQWVIFLAQKDNDTITT